jgi:hypothetical protein
LIIEVWLITQLALRQVMERTDSMADLATYKDAFAHAKITRSKSGVLEVALHTNGDTLVFNGHTHEQFVTCFTRSAPTPITALSS